MPDTAWFTLRTEDPSPRLCLQGRWRLEGLPAIAAALATMDALPATDGAPLQLDGRALEALDSAAAQVLLDALARRGIDIATLVVDGFAPAPARVLDQVRAQWRPGEASAEMARRGVVGEIGRHALEIVALVSGHLQFFGLTLLALAELLRAPRRLRGRELVVQLELAGLNAVPVVALVTLLIGIVIAYLLGMQAEKYGASIFVVDGVGIGATREFAPILVAVIVAGRSGAAFTAQLGSMRLTEEIDAIRTLGLSPEQVLVVPRVLALMLALPLLVFVGDVMSIAGAMAISGPMLDLAPAAFLARLREALDARHVFIGLVKAPVFALAIAVIGTRMGMTVGRDTRAVGAATTSTVVQSIVAVILLDAAFAVLLQALDL